MSIERWILGFDKLVLRSEICFGTWTLAKEQPNLRPVRFREEMELLTLIELVELDPDEIDCEMSCARFRDEQHTICC